MILLSPDVSLRVFSGPKIDAALAVMNMRIRICSHPPVPPLAQHRVPKPTDYRRELIETAEGSRIAVIAPWTRIACTAILVERRRLMPRRSCHANRNVGRRIVPISQFGRGVLTVHTNVFGRTRRMIGYKYRCPLLSSHKSQRFEQARLCIPTRVSRPWLALSETRLDGK